MTSCQGSQSLHDGDHSQLGTWRCKPYMQTSFPKHESGWHSLLKCIRPLQLAAMCTFGFQKVRAEAQVLRDDSDDNLPCGGLGTGGQPRQGTGLVKRSIHVNTGIGDAAFDTKQRWQPMQWAPSQIETISSWAQPQSAVGEEAAVDSPSRLGQCEDALDEFKKLCGKPFSAQTHTLWRLARYAQ